MAFPSRLDCIRSAACVSRVSATVHFWERGERGRTREGGTIARMQTINEITVRLLPLSLFRTGGKEGDGGEGLSDVSVRLEGRTDDRLVHVQEDEEVSTQQNQRKVWLNRLINYRKCIYTAL